MSHRKNILLSFQPVVAGDMSGGSITAPVTNLNYLDDIGYQFVWTGSPSGTFQIQISADYAQDSTGNVTNAGHWTPITLTYWNGAAFVTSNSIPTTVGSPIYLDLALLSAPWIRSVYTGTGAGLLTVTITAKEI